jgi:hypothetical protein
MYDLRWLWPHPPKLKVSQGCSIDSTYVQTAHHRLHHVFKGRVSCWEYRVSVSTATERKNMYSKQKYFSTVSTSAKTLVQSALHFPQPNLYTYRVGELPQRNIRVQPVTKDRPVDARLARGSYISAIATTSGCNLNGIDALKFLKCKRSIHHTVATKISKSIEVAGSGFQDGDTSVHAWR